MKPSLDMFLILTMVTLHLLKLELTLFFPIQSREHLALSQRQPLNPVVDPPYSVMTQ